MIYIIWGKKPPTDDTFDLIISNNYKKKTVFIYFLDFMFTVWTTKVTSGRLITVMDGVKFEFNDINI